MGSDNSPGGMKKEWFREWFDENYQLLYRHRNMADAERQVNLIINRVQPEKSWKILDLCCGEGRHAVLIRDRGYDITGLDLSETLIRSGKEKFPELDLVRCDMRFIPGIYDLILSLFTSFGYFNEEEENRKVLSGVYGSLHSGGIFWLDFLNADQIIHSPPRGIRERELDGLRVTEEKRVEGERINKIITFFSPSGERKYTESVRLYSKRELEGMLEDIGFQIPAVYGDYSGAPWTSMSERAIFHCKKYK